MVKSKKNKKDFEASAVAVAGASDSDEDDEIMLVQKKKKSVFQMFALDDDEDVDGRGDDDDGEDDDDDDEETEAVTVSKKSKKQKNKKAATKIRKTLDDDDDEFDFIEKEKEKPKGKKEKKGKNRKKNNEDEEEIERMLAELELEYQGATTTKKPTTTVVTEDKVESTKEEDTKKKKKKKKQKERDDDDAGEDEEVEVDEDLQEDKRKKKKTKKKGKGTKVEDETKADVTDDDQIKEEEKELEEKAEATSESKPVEELKNEEKKENDDDDAADSDDKKKPEKKEKEDKKRPGKRQLLVMQEALKKMKEEEERLASLEEAKIKAAEEAERLRQEQLRLAKERKELAKQREKEKKERLKAEGKLLTKAQMAQRARAIATIEAFRAQGIDVPSIGEKRDRPVRPATRSKVSRGKTNANKGGERAKNGVESVKESLDSVETLDKLKSADKIETIVLPLATDLKPAEPVPVVKIEEPKDNWDLSSDSENCDDAGNKKTEDVTCITKTVQISIREEPASKVNKPLPKTKTKSVSESESSEEESESEDESDDDDESESDDNQKSAAEKLRERALARIQKRREENEKKRSQDNLRSPIVCVLGHVDTGKTKILDKIRHTHVQDNEAGGITQQIGATMVPVDAIKEQAKMVKNFSSITLRYPGLLIIDTPGHESFSNLRSRGSSLCDIAILVVDIMHGLEPQTIESINLLKKKKTPFVVALNKVDRFYDWKVTRNKDIRDSIKSQSRNTTMEFEDRTNQVIVQFAEQGLNAALFYENKDVRTFVSLVPTSATTGEGMGNLLALVVELTQNMLAKRLAFTEELQATVLELKAIPGLGTTIDVILVNGRLKEGDTMVLAGMDGPVVTQIRSLLMPQPLKEMRVKNPYQEYKEIKAAQGVKITAKDLEKVIAGLNLTIAHHPDEVDILKEDVSREFRAAMNSIKLAERGVYVQASTLGSLEALLEFLRTSKVPYSGIRIGPVVKRDVMKASIMLEHDSQFAVILAFDVKIERDAHDLADNLGVKIFSADIIYHLFDRFTEYREQLKAKKREEFKHIAVFPCKLRILPNCIFNSRDPIVVGVSVEAGVVKEGTTLCVPSQEFLDVGIVTTIEINHKQIDTARKGQEVCIKIEPIPGEAPKLYGRHFDHTDILVSKVSRQSIDACKEYFRDDLLKSDWQLMVELKKLFQIL